MFEAISETKRGEIFREPLAWVVVGIVLFVLFGLLRGEPRATEPGSSGQTDVQKQEPPRTQSERLFGPRDYGGPGRRF